MYSFIGLSVPTSSNPLPASVELGFAAAETLDQFTASLDEYSQSIVGYHSPRVSISTLVSIVPRLKANTFLGDRSSQYRQSRHEPDPTAELLVQRHGARLGFWQNHQRCKTPSPPHFRDFGFGYNAINLTAMRASSGVILIDFHPQILRKSPISIAKPVCSLDGRSA